MPERDFDLADALDVREEKLAAMRCSATFPCARCRDQMLTLALPRMLGQAISWCEERRISRDGP